MAVWWFDAALPVLYRRPPDGKKPSGGLFFQYISRSHRVRRASTRAVLPWVFSSFHLMIRAGLPATTAFSRHVLDNHRTGGHHRVPADADPLDDHRVGPNQNAVLHNDRRGRGRVPPQRRPACPCAMWQSAPPVARPPSTAPMSIMVPRPTTAPMFKMAPIMMMAPSPISTFSRMMAPGSMRALISLIVQQGTPESRRSLSTTSLVIFPALASTTGPEQRPVPEDGTRRCQRLWHRRSLPAGGIHIDLDGGLFLRSCNIVDDFLCVHSSRSK